MMHAAFVHAESSTQLGRIITWAQYELPGEAVLPVRDFWRGDKVSIHPHLCIGHNRNMIVARISPFTLVRKTGIENRFVFRAVLLNNLKHLISSPRAPVNASWSWVAFTFLKEAKPQLPERMIPAKRHMRPIFVRCSTIPSLAKQKVRWCLTQTQYGICRSAKAGQTQA